MSTAARGGKRAVPGRAGGARARPPGTVSKPVRPGRDGDPSNAGFDEGAWGAPRPRLELSGDGRPPPGQPDLAADTRGRAADARAPPGGWRRGGGGWPCLGGPRLAAGGGGDHTTEPAGAGEDAGTETQTGALVSRAAWPAVRSGADGPRGAGSSRGQCLHGASGAT